MKIPVEIYEIILEQVYWIWIKEFMDSDYESAFDYAFNSIAPYYDSDELAFPDYNYMDYPFAYRILTHPMSNKHGDVIGTTPDRIVSNLEFLKFIYSINFFTLPPVIEVSDEIPCKFKMTSDYECKAKIWFHNSPTEKQLKIYREYFDLILDCDYSVTVFHYE